MKKNPLGTMGKSAAAFPGKNNVREKIRQQRRALWRGRKIIKKQSDEIQSKLKGLLGCGTNLHFGSAQVTVKDTDTHAFFSGVQSCHSVWSCPVCAPRILRRRSEEIDKILDKVYQSQMKAAMVTFTFHHTRNQKLDEIIRIFKGALRKFNSNRAGRKFFRSFGLRYKIEGFETTHGKNGWHFHCHTLWIVSDEGFSALDKAEESLKEYWLDCVRKSGGSVPDTDDFLRRGFILSRDDNGSVMECHSGRYICGWGADNELTGLSTKSCKNGNRDPFQLLETDDVKDAELWIEYCLATKGKRRIVFSRGLKKWAGIAENTDEEILEEEKKFEESEGREICIFDAVKWRVIVEADHTSGIPVLMEILEVAHSGGYVAVYNFCVSNNLPVPLPAN